MNWMKAGIDSGITQPKVVLTGFEQSIQAFIKESPEQSQYYKPFEQFPAHFSETLKESLREEASTLIASHVFVSYKRFYQFFMNDYLVNARENIAATSLPDGAQFYQKQSKALFNARAFCR